ncbi:MAG: hypothetical protein M3129_02735 [Thermoproteota archaeon]|nr:hypothetical protein [Thermoproteota archaeon]
MSTVPQLPMKVTIILPIVVITISLLLVQPVALQIVWSQQGNDTTITTDATSNINPGVYPPGSAPYNLTYGEWGAKWWQWVLSLPQDINPLIDQTGEHCAQAQSGPVWFLAGTFGGSAERTCTIPEGKAILFPVLNSGNVKTDPSETEEDLRVTTKEAVDNPAILEASVDGVPLHNLQNYRAESPVFNVTLSEGNIFGVPELNSEAVSDGYWVMLEPLPVGDHSVNFRGADTAAVAGGLVTEVTYKLTIAPEAAATTTTVTNATEAGDVQNADTTTTIT